MRCVLPGNQQVLVGNIAESMTEISLIEIEFA